MFKLGVISDEISQDFERVLQVLAEYEVPTVEPRSVWDKNPQELDAEDVARMKKLLNQYGISVCSIATPFLKCDMGDEEQYAQHLEILRRCLELAQELEAPVIRTFVFWRTAPAREVWQQLLDAYEVPVKMAEEAGVVLGMENEASTHLATAREAAEFCAAINHPRVRAIWDPANEVYADEGVLPFPDAFEQIKPWMIHMHIKDAVRGEDGQARCVPVGDGGYIDYPGQFKALMDMGYEGVCSLETHWRPTEELDEDLLNRPGGAAFSATGEPASRICLEKIYAILDSIGWQRS
ncbi:MAG: sugar phosphate isomerase/epimerase [Armatimonadetes bacterium]|nr:sugar phosphate isomerase/epimerase [Armatimonadota bacterium]